MRSLVSKLPPARSRSGAFNLTFKGGAPFRSVSIAGDGTGHTGNLLVDSGTLRACAGDTINNGSTVNVSATFDLGNTEQLIGNRTGNGAVLIGSGRLIFDSDTRATDFDGQLTGGNTFTGLLTGGGLGTAIKFGAN